MVVTPFYAILGTRATTFPQVNAGPVSLLHARGMLPDGLLLKAQDIGRG